MRWRTRGFGCHDDDNIHRYGRGADQALGVRLLAGNPVTVGSAVVLAVVVFVAATAQWIAPFGINDVDVPNALRPPGGEHWFGTDELGRDVFSRVLVAVQASMRVAVVSVAFAVVVGVTIGVIAGYRGGWLDTVVMRVVDVMFAFPVLLLALAVVAILGPGVTTTILAIGIVYTPIFARVARASTLSVRVEPFVQVSRTMGTGHLYMLRTTHPAQHRGTADRADVAVAGVRDPVRGGAVVPRAGHSTAAAVVGPDDLRLPGLRDARVVDGGVPRRRHRRHRAGVQPARGRAARRARSQAAHHDRGSEAQWLNRDVRDLRVRIGRREIVRGPSTSNVSRRSGSSANQARASR